MPLQFSHAVGYRGLCRLRDKLLLCTGGNINLTQDPIMSSGVWGAGYAVAAPIAYAWNYLNLQGSANFELTTGGEWVALKEFAFSDRTSRSYLKLLPDGQYGFLGYGWCSSLSFDASEGAAITGSFNFKGNPDTSDDDSDIEVGGMGDSQTVEGIKADDGTATYGSLAADETFVNNLAGSTLIPYWRTTVFAGDGEGQQVSEDIISWNCSYNSDLQMLKCCRKEAEPPKHADYILCGQMSGDASLTVFKIQGQFDPQEYHKPFKGLTFKIGKATGDSFALTNAEGSDEGNKESYIKIPLAVINSASTSMTSGASYITAEFSYTALGDGHNPIMTMN